MLRQLIGFIGRHLQVNLGFQLNRIKVLIVQQEQQNDNQKAKTSDVLNV